MALPFPGVDPKENPYLAGLEQKSGHPNAFFRTLAHSPKALETFVPFYDAVMGPGALDHRIKEIAYLAVSYANECPYCIAAHEKSAAKIGMSEDEMRAIKLEQDHLFNERERAALTYARELTRTCEPGDQHGVLTLFSNQEVVELTLVVGVANLTNRVNNGLNVDPEDRT